jgi:hypothetical protein
MRGGDLFKSKRAIKKRIPTESKKRKEEKKYYAQSCKELTAEIRAQNEGHIYCFFTNKELFDPISYHHLKKRTGKFYTDKEWLVPAGAEHLDYHFKSVEWLLDQWWYEKVFLVNLRLKSEMLYQQELNRQEKSNKLNPRINFNDNDDIF